MKSKQKPQAAIPGPSKAKTWKGKKSAQSKNKIQPNPIMGSIWEVLKGEVATGFFF